MAQDETNILTSTVSSRGVYPPQDLGAPMPLALPLLLPFPPLLLTSSLHSLALEVGTL